MRTVSSMVFVAACLVGAATPSASQITQRNAQFWLPADYNNVFYDTYPEAARSFYAAHYAHFSVYEVGMGSTGNLEPAIGEMAREIRRLIDDPPRFEPPIDVIAPEWSKIGYRTGAAMDWTHHLHEQLYDILSDDRVLDKRAAGERAISYYLTNPDAAFSTRGYGHAFMLGGGTWAGSFARQFPEVNGILWAYHWHHASIYEALMESDPADRQRELDRVLTTFVDSVLVDPPAYMPFTAEMAPRFAEMFPAAAHIFDNLHMMHDVVNDIMVDPGVPSLGKGREIERLRQQMIYANQDWVVPPEVPAEDRMAMPMSSMRVPTQLPDGRWLPQGHPRAAMMGGETRFDGQRGGVP